MEIAKNMLKKFNQNVSKENLTQLYNFLLEKTQQQKLIQNEIELLRRKIKEREKDI